MGRWRARAACATVVAVGLLGSLAMMGAVFSPHSDQSAPLPCLGGIRPDFNTQFGGDSYAVVLAGGAPAMGDVLAASCRIELPFYENLNPLPFDEISGGYASDDLQPLTTQVISEVLPKQNIATLASATVPEPSSLGLLAVAASWFFHARRRHRRSCP